MKTASDISKAASAISAAYDEALDQGPGMVGELELLARRLGRQYSCVCEKWHPGPRCSGRARRIAAIPGRLTGCLNGVRKLKGSSIHALASLPDRHERNVGARNNEPN